MLRELGVIQSFSRPHMPYDNSVSESFFASMKREELYRKDYRSKKELLSAIDTYIQFYNEGRPHSVTRNQPPSRFEARYYEKTTANDVN